MHKGRTITLITPTGMRPEAFALCEKWILRQTVKPDEWIVVDDGVIHTPITLTTKIIRPEVKWKAKTNSQGSNLYLAFQFAQGDYIVFIEDDDWYRENYLESLMDKIIEANAHIVGEGEAIFYHVGQKKWRALGNKEFCCLAHTVIHNSLAPFVLQGIAKNERYLDKYLWNEIKKFHEIKSLVIYPEPKLSVSIKGLPGRPGIVSGHRFNSWWNRDDNWGKLVGVIGEEDLKEYEKIWKQIHQS